MAKKFISVRKAFYEEVVNLISTLLKNENRDEFLKLPRQDQRGRLAKAVDFIAVRIIFFFLFGFFFSLYFSMWVSLVLAFIGTGLAHLLLSRKEKRNREISLGKMKQYIARNHAFEKIMKMEPHREFKIFITQVLNGLKGFSGMQLIDDRTNADNFDIIGTFKNVPVAVKCRRYEQKNEVGKEEVQKFASMIKKAGLDRGIFLTTSRFSDWAIDYVQSIKDEIRIVLVDKAKLIEWVRLSKHSIYPNEQEIEQLEIKKKQEEKKVSLKRKEARNRRLMRSFFLVTAYLTFLSFFMHRWLESWLLTLYFVIAIVNLALGLVFYYLYMHTKELINEASTLEQLD